MKKRKKNRKLQFQKLAKRELMAGDISLSSRGVLEIDGTRRDDTAHVGYVGSQVKATLNGRSESFAKSKVKKIIFRGYGSDDYFDNDTSIRTSAYGHGGNDELYGGPGKDYLSGGDNNDTIKGGGDNDTIYGGDGRDKLYGGSSKDYLHGGDSNDTIYGGSGNDTLYGGTGRDSMLGGSGNDYMAGYTGNDTLKGGSGNDHVRGNADNDDLYGGSGNDTLYGGSGNDHLEGESGNDRLYGESGHDDLYGHGGTDYLSGGSGRDGLYGGGSTSKDTLRGGRDADRFITQPGDKIADYSSRDDARLHFVNGSANWNNAEIQTADKAFRKLHHKTRNTKLLRDPFTKKTLRFSKESDAWMNRNFKKTTLAVNSSNHQRWKTKTWNYGKFKWDHHHHERRTRIIRLRDWNNSRSSERSEAVDTVIHEIAHNWDGNQAGESHKQWKSFKQLHDRSRSSDFVSSYAKTNAHEDWAETFARYVDRGTASRNATVRKKLSAVDAFFKSMS